jgi:hypothetical protein
MDRTMKQKEELKLKMALISLLSNPDVILTIIDFINDTETIPPDNITGYPNRVLNGTSHYHITVYNSKKDGRKKSKK